MMLVRISGVTQRKHAPLAVGVDAALIGEALVTAQDPGAKLRELLA